MKNYLFTFILAILLNPLLAQAQLKHITGLEKMPDHPRLLLLKGEEENIKISINNNESLAKIHKAIIDESDNIITLNPLQRTLIGKRLLETSGELLRRVFFLSYAYRMTREEKYLKKAEFELLTVSEFSDWNPSHFLDVAEMTMGVAIGYDWLYHDLSATSLATIKNALLKKGLEPSLIAKNNSWQKSSSNWNQVCNTSMSYGALAIYEDNPSLSSLIVDRAIETIQLPMQAYKPDGGYPEGYGYWNYGTGFNLLFLSALEKIFGSDFNLSNIEGFLKTPNYYQNMLGSSGFNFNYSDTANSLSNLSPSMFWFAQRTNDLSLLFNEKQHLESKNMAKNKILPVIMLWAKDIDFNQITPPNLLTWVSQGANPVAMMRTSWVNPDGIYVGLKAGSPSISHAHMDIGSFVMDAQGVRWASDLGMQSYYSLESKGIKIGSMSQDSQRWTVYRLNNFSHNTLTFDGALQKANGYAAITSYSNEPNFMSATTNISNIYSNKVTSVKRGVAIVDTTHVVIKDEIEASDKATIVRWAMVTPATVKILNKNTAELTQKGKKLYLKVHNATNITLKTWSTNPPNTYDAPNIGTTIIGFETTIAAKTKKVLTVLLMPDKIILNTNKIKSLQDW